jgi:predicted aldo/keto reductase-like oxidoreductase
MSSNPSRREFLSAGLAAGVALPVLGAARAAALPVAQAPAAAPAVPAQPVKLDDKVLGRTGLRVTTVGFGCMITSDPSVVQRAADLGINYFDTARSYQHGNNERMVGAALGAHRKNIILSSKTHAPDKAGMMAELDQSLHELNTDHLDIWYLHARDTSTQIHDDMIEAQQLARQQGKIRFAGVSTHLGQQQLIPWMIQKGAFDVVLVAYNFTMDQGMRDALAAAAQSGMGVVAMKIMAGGSHNVRPTNPNYQKLTQPGAMLAALKWVVNQPHVHTTVPSMTDMDQLDENMRAMGAPLSPDDHKTLAAHLESIRPLYCRLCGECKDACQKGLPVADVLRCLTYAEGYGQFALGRERFLELDARHRAVRCADCAECTVACPHGVHVRERVSRAQEILA